MHLIMSHGGYTYLMKKQFPWVFNSLSLGPVTHNAHLFHLNGIAQSADCSKIFSLNFDWKRDLLNLD